MATSIAFKIIKSSSFKTDSVEGTNYTLAYKGRVIMLSSLDFDDDMYQTKDSTLIVKTDIELVKGGFDFEGKSYPPRLKQRMDLTFGEF